MKKRSYKIVDWNNIIWCIIGAIIFLVIYGIIPLDVTNDKWIYNGYAEQDIIQHYTGWMEYRNSEWSFPLGKIPSLNGDECSMYISFTDSIPLLAMIFKMFRGVLPYTFQYFGWYILICFVLQSFFAGKMISLFVHDNKYVCLSCILMTVSPVLIERAFRHTALASHWLILAALYLYFKGKQDKLQMKCGGGYILLNILGVLIHPYFVPMILGIMCGLLLEEAIANKSWHFAWKPIGILMINMACIILTGYCIGLFGSIQVVHENSIGGYGYFSMNLNALINPISHGYGCFGFGNSKWSLVLPVREQILGNYDGFNYLGIGVLGSLLVIFVILCIQKETREKCLKKVKENYGLLFVLILLTIYALSNVVTFDDKTLITYAVPSVLYPVLSTFKASSRFFYPVLYMIDIFIIYLFGRIIKSKKCIIMAVIVTVQIIDFSSVLLDKRLMFTDMHISEIYEARSEGLEEWKENSENYDKVVLLDPEADPSIMYEITYAAAKTKTKNNFNIMNRGDISILQEKTDFLVQNTVMGGKLENGEMYLFRDERYAASFRMCLKETADIQQLKPGYYEFYQVVQVEDGEETTGNNEEQINFEELSETANGVAVIDSVLENSNSCRVTGYTFINDCDINEQLMFLSILTNDGENILLPLRNVKRADCLQEYGEEYEYSGFEIYLQNELKNKAESVYLKVINKDNVMSVPIEV